MWLGRLGNVFWFFDDFSAFYLQYGIILAFCFGIFLVKRKWVHATVALIPILIILSFHLPPSTARGSADIEQATLNEPVGIFMSNVLYSNTHYEKLKEEIHKFDPEVIVLEESDKSWESNLQDIIEEFPYGLNVTDRGYSSMIVRSKIPVQESIYHQEFETPVIELVFENFSVIGAHPLAPVNKEFFESRNRDLEKLAKLLESKERAIVIGDMNTNIYSPHLYPFMNYHTTQYGVPHYLSWPTQLGIGAATLDHAFIKNLSLTDFEKGDVIGSDHWPIYAEVQ